MEEWWFKPILKNMRKVNECSGHLLMNYFFKKKLLRKKKF